MDYFYNFLILCAGTTLGYVLCTYEYYKIMKKREIIDPSNDYYQISLLNKNITIKNHRFKGLYHVDFIINDLTYEILIHHDFINHETIIVGLPHSAEAFDVNEIKIRVKSLLENEEPLEGTFIGNEKINLEKLLKKKEEEGDLMEAYD